MDNNSLRSHSLQDEDIEYFKSTWPIYITSIVFIFSGIFAYNAGMYALTTSQASAGDKISFIMGLLVFIGVIISFLGVIYQNKYRINIEVLSKNRQEWINELRKEVAFFNSSVESILRSLRDNYTVGNNEVMAVIEEKRGELSNSYYYIRLLLSSSQQKENSSSRMNAEELVEKIEDLKTRMDSYTAISSTQYQEISKSIDEAKKEICDVTEKILKEEWVRVKKGK